MEFADGLAMCWKVVVVERRTISDFRFWLEEPGVVGWGAGMEVWGQEVKSKVLQPAVADTSGICPGLPRGSTLSWAVGSRP